MVSLCLKKVHTEDLLQLAILLSLMRTEYIDWPLNSPSIEIGLHEERFLSWDTSHSYHRLLHPKSVDSVLLDYQEEILRDLNSLGRYNRPIGDTIYRTNVTAYLGLTNSDSEPIASTSSQLSPCNHDTESLDDLDDILRPDGEEDLPFFFKDDDSELSQEDMDLIEVLWKQDVDMGFSLEQLEEVGPGLVAPAAAEAEVVHEKCKASKIGSEPLPDKKVGDEPEDDDPWAGLPYTIDVETGECEFIRKVECDAVTESGEDDPPSALLDQADFSLEEALQLVGLNEDTFELPECAAVPERELPVVVEGAHEGVLSESLSEAAAESPLTETSLEEDLDLLAEMIQAPNYHHPRTFQEYGYSLCYDLRGQSSGGECLNPAPNNTSPWQRLTEIKDNFSRMPHGSYVRSSMNIEQRWQDLASLLSLPPPPGGSAATGGEYQGQGPHHHHGHPHPHPHPHHHGHMGHHHQPYLAPPHAFQPPPASAPHAPDKLLHNPTAVQPPTPSLPPDPYSPISSGNLGTAVASSMNLMTNNSEPMPGDGSTTNFKMENPHDLMYYQNGSGGEMGHNNNADGFLSSILNDEDLQLMDMAMNEGMYTMRMLEGSNGGGTGTGAGGTGGGGNGGDSDSAVSSMGSERVPSLTSDTDWMETNSDSGHTPADHFMTDYHSKYRWYDYGYTRQHSGEATSSGTHRMPPVAQKKHHLYGKRFFHEQTAGNNSPVLPQNSPSCTGNGTTPIKFEFNNRSSSSSGSNGAGSGGATAASPLVATSSFSSPPLDIVKEHQPEMKYSCSVEFTRQNLAGVRSSPAEAAVHNHTYHMPPEQSGVLQRPLTRDKKVRKSEDHHLTRDERRARALNIPITVDDIINLPMDEFNERLSKYDLSEAQLSLIRDIRRRGKNKVAAQNCRKRKLDQILSLTGEVAQMKEKKQRLLQERERLQSESRRVKSRFAQLYTHIFQALRDPDGNPYSLYEWSLQQSADGTVVLIPRGNQTMLDQTDTPRPPKKPHDQRKP